MLGASAQQASNNVQMVSQAADEISASASEINRQAQESSGIAQQAVAAALNHPESGADVAAATRVWQQRSTLVLDQLAGYPCVRPHGG